MLEAVSVRNGGEDAFDAEVLFQLLDSFGKYVTIFQFARLILLIGRFHGIAHDGGGVLFGMLVKIEGEQCDVLSIDPRTVEWFLCSWGDTTC